MRFSFPHRRRRVFSFFDVRSSFSRFSDFIEASARKTKMLSNAYFLAKFRFDTAEKEPAKKLKKFALFLHCQRFVSTMPVPLTLVKIPQVPELLGAEADAALRRYFRCIFFTEYQRNSEFRMHEQTDPASYARLTECEQ